MDKNIKKDIVKPDWKMIMSYATIILFASVLIEFGFFFHFFIGN